ATNDLLEDFRRQFAEVSRLAGEEGDIATLTALGDRVGALETVLEEITAASGSASPASALQIAGLRSELQTAMDDLTAAQQKLQAKVTAMDGQLIALQKTSQDMAATMSNVNQAASERLQAMDNALAALEIRRDAGPVSQMERRAAMALSFASLARTVETGKPFRAELDTARAFAGDQPGLDVLGAHADTGLETVKSLTERFAAVAGQIVNADHGSAEGGALDRFWGKLQSIVRVRPTGFVEGDTSAAIVARAESRLQAGQLSGTIAELETLSGPAQEAAQSWLEPARARRDGDSALAALNADLIASITMDRNADQPDAAEQTGTEKDASQ
ncbi:MAG: hypothetical protein K8F25_06785, partial [Fimbriimonadaceae bacterium]|nr:hypothetical protein [Alphaproteobacteria bacterium]